MSAGESPTSDPAPEALIVCGLCRHAMPGSQYERHLRSAHQLVVYQGVRRDVPDTLEAIHFDLFSEAPSSDAWEVLARLARDEHADDALPWLAGWLVTMLQRLPSSRRDAVLPPLAALVARDRDLVALLAGRPEPVARRLALEVIARLPAPLPPSLVRPARLLLNDRDASEELQACIVAAALMHRDGERLAARMLRWFTAGLPAKAAARRLRGLLKAVGPHSLLTVALERHQGRRRLQCPRCGADLSREEMERHLWAEHRLLLEGLRVRDPWEVVEEWADDYRARRDPAMLERLRLASARLDPEGGPARLERLLLARGLGDPDAQRARLTLAREEHAGCCPWCYALVPVPRELPPLDINLRPGRLSAGGYEVEVDERGLFTRLLVRTPLTVLHADREPGRSFTPRGAAAAAAGPIVLLALLAAALWPIAWFGLPLPPVAFLLLVATLAGLLAGALARFDRPAKERVFDHAWTMLAPRLFADGYNLADSRFLAGLARLSSRQERTDVPEAALRAALALTEEAAILRRAPAGHLAALCRLSAECAAARGGDPVALVARWVALAFEGKVPLAFAQNLFEDWAADWWSPGQLCRLRVWVLDRAFEAGFEVQGLLDAGQTAPALGTVIGTNAPRRLAALRLLWSLRASRPWDRLGDVRTAFELAQVPARVAIFEALPDVLLWQEDRTNAVTSESGATGPAVIRLTLSGVWVQAELFAMPPRLFEVRQRGPTWEMRLGRVTFRLPNDPEPLVRTLEKWLRYAFHEFLPQVDRVREWVSPDRSALLAAWGAVACPECGRHLLPRVGEVGLAMEEKRA